jgi:predicted RNA binding protein YcfA (HicA-like mRNA interferase family)
MSGKKLPDLDAKQVVRALERAGFEKWRQRGSHLTLFRTHDRRAVTVPIHFARSVPKGTLKAILRSSGLRPEDLLG